MMPNYDSMLKVDLTDFTAWAKKHVGRDWPKAVVDAFSDIAKTGRDDVRDLTKRKFGLHSEFIPQGIRSTPRTSAQKSAAQNAMKRFGDCNAAVFIRGANDPRKGLDFMADHEVGETREPQGKSIAVPTTDLRKRSFRTGRGAVKKVYKPAELLKRFHQTNSRFTGKTTVHSGGRGFGYKRKGGKLPGHAFIIGTRSGPMIARRIKSGLRKGQFGPVRGLEFLYSLQPRANFKAVWGFVARVHRTVKDINVQRLHKAVMRLPSGK